MSILGIENRTENWKTAESFCELSENGRVSLVRRLCGAEVPASEIKLELFWYGMRDYVYEHGGVEEESAASYRRTFSDLRGRIASFEQTDGTRILKFDPLKSSNYSTKSEYRSKLYSNLTHTEIDIVLETSDYLFIGEAKDESDLGTGGENVLVHQLIREYVMARILVDLTNREKKIVPFVVVNESKLDNIKNTCQVRFMADRDRGWLKERNVLSWNCIKQLDQ